MRIMHKKKILKNLFLLSITTVLILSPLFINLNLNNSIGNEKSGTSNNNLHEDNVLTSFTQEVDDTYDTSGSWWNNMWSKRIAINIENNQSHDRYEPVDIALTFEAGSFYAGTQRVVRFLNPGWSDPLPIQLYNKVGTTYITSCNVVFMVNVPANNNATYFFYYHASDSGINTSLTYDTGFISDLVGSPKTLTVEVHGESYDDYRVTLSEEGASGTLQKGSDLDTSDNYHSSSSLAPEKIDYAPSLETLSFSAHLDDSSTTFTTHAISESVPAGYDGTVSDGDNWYPSSGITNGAYLFDGDDYINFGGIMTSSNDPFDAGVTQWTFMCWVKPLSLTYTPTSQGTQNVIASYSRVNPEADRFEIGINNDGSIHVYLYVNPLGEINDDFFSTSTPVTIGSWHFIALTVDFTSSPSVYVWCDDLPKESSYLWDGTGNTQMPSPAGVFNLGYKDQKKGSDVYFNGYMDEVQLYKTMLSDTEINNTYKYSSNPQTKTTGTISSITQVYKGSVFSQYTVVWNPVSTLRATDTVRFYYDYNLWSLRRQLYLTTAYDQTSDGPLIPLNAYYDFSLATPTSCYYSFDGTFKDNLAVPSDLEGWENYTVITALPEPTDHAIGILIEDWQVTGAATMNNFNGSVAYDSGIVEVKPGANHDYQNSGGGSSNKIVIDFWELIDTAPSITPGNFTEYYNDVFLALKNPLNFYIFNAESLTYDIAVYVTDHDLNVVPGATIKLLDENGTELGSTTTDTSGEATFIDVVNGSYSLNISYTDYGFTLDDIYDPITIDDLSNASINKVATANFSQVSLTSIVLNCTYISSEDPVPFEGDLNFTYYYDTGSSPQILSGVEQCDEDGIATFRWRNATVNGNVTIQAYSFLGWIPVLVTEPITDDMDIYLDTVTVNFTQFTTYYLNASFDIGGGSITFNTSIVVLDTNYDYISEVRVDIEDSFTILLNYSWVSSNNSYGPITKPVSMNLKLSAVQVNLNPISFTHIGNGIYTLTMDTSDPIDAGGVSWDAGVNYVAEITGEDGTENNSLTITLNRYTTRLSIVETETSVNWYESLSFDVQYEYDNSGSWTGITGASVSYYVIGYSSIYGTLTPIGNGVYRFSINSTKFPRAGEYFVHLSATKKNYNPQSDDQFVSILEISTKLNNSETNYFYEESLYLGEEKIFYLEYTNAFTGNIISGAEIASFDWIKKINGVKVDEGDDVSLTDLGNGLYELDFNTEDLSIALYIFDIEIKKTNHETRRATISLYITKRDFKTTVSQIYSVVSGNDLRITICLEDMLSGDPITDILPGEMNVTFLGKTYNFTGSTNGCYVAVITNIPDDVFAIAETLPAVIFIARENYTTLELPVSIEVKIIEWGGVPAFYIVIGIIMAVVVVSTLVSYRVIQVRRIPKFIKKSKSLIKTISSKGAITKSMLYPSKETFVAKMFEDHWKVHDLSLSDILGVGKAKKAPTGVVPKKPIKGGGEMK